MHHKSTETISVDEAFKDLTGCYGKAGALLKGIRIREGLTQTEFAKLINTTQAIILNGKWNTSNWEKQS